MILTPENELITHGLRVWLRLNENTGSTATDSSGNGFSGTIVGSPSWISGGAPVAGGHGLELSGTGQYITLDSTAALAAMAINPPVSIMAWVRPDTDAVTNSAFFSIANTGQANRFFVVYLGDGITTALTDELITIAHNNGATLIIGYTTATRTQLFDGGWHHIAVVSNGSAWAIYLDGSSKTVTVGTGSNTGLYNVTSTNAVRVGCRSINGALNSLPFDGGLDDFRFYNRALSAAEIAAIYIGRG